ncbi:hypothetical protein ACS0TY_023966 [Phlomoides rotata]
MDVITGVRKKKNNIPLLLLFLSKTNIRNTHAHAFFKKSSLASPSSIHPSAEIFESSSFHHHHRPLPILTLETSFRRRARSSAAATPPPAAYSGDRNSRIVVARLHRYKPRGTYIVCV